MTDSELRDSDYESEVETETEEEETKTYMAKIYKLYYKEDPAQFYVGSTSQKLIDRFRNHRFYAKTQSSKLYRFMRLKGINNFAIQMEAEVEVSSDQDLRRFEQLSIDLLKPTLNAQRALRTKAQKKEQTKQYHETNKNKYRCETCDYGCSRPSHMRKHNETIRHRQNVRAEIRASEAESDSENSENSE